ncbi:hypothetical protein MPER_02454 [Moniliophthora perniciosa FA553]|nr:hypothetical protein MPER_02454 [Moniliophthora perniciosa FA553]
MDLSPLQAYVTAITPILKLLILSTVWSAALIPLLILLFFLSTATVRKQPIFILNVFSVSMGVIIGIANVKLFAGQILTPTDFIPIRTLLAYMGMILAMPILMDCILAYRLSAVYPRRTTSRRLLAVIFIPIILFKVARTVNLTIFMVMFSKDI